MDAELARLIRNDTPQFNPRLANGFAVEATNTVTYDTERKKYFTGCLRYVDQLFRAAVPSFPKELEYVDCERCTPEEEFAFETRVRWQKKKQREFDLVKNDVYLCKFHFRWLGKLYTHYLFLPFLGEAGSFHLRGSRYFVVPVLMDPIITKKIDRIFVRLMKTRFNVRREAVYFMADGKRQTVQLHYTRIFQNIQGDKDAQKGHVSLIHYLFCKYGFSATFEQFAQAHPVLGGAEINENTHPPNEWVICSSRQVAPSQMRKRSYQPSLLRIAIRREEYTSLVRKYVGAFFYVVDRHPQRLTAETAESKVLWRILLGLFIFGPLGEGIIQDKVNRHMEWLDEYVDYFTQMKIRQLGWPVTNTFELFAFMVEHYEHWWLTDKAPGPTMYGKQLEVNYFLLSDLMRGIHTLCFQLRSKKRPRNLEDLKQTFSRVLHPEIIFKLRSNHSELMTFGASGDNYAVKVASKIVPQERYIRPKYKSEEQAMKARHPFELLHASVAEIGSYAKLSRQSPDGRDNVNLCAHVDENGTVQRNPAFVELLDGIQQEIEGSRNR